MSAGGLSYDCLVTSRKVTLPSVEMWGTNMNILKDPPKSLYTRRIDKVGDTQQVLLAQEASGDRIAECINVYARGVNPMVSVSYDNNSNNAGARGSIISNFNTSVKLPYKPEVFHPPVFRQEDLMPLSRQPRNWFYALANPEIPNIVHQMSCPEGRSAVWDSDRVLHADAPARIQYNNEAPLTNSELPAMHKSIRQDDLQADRLWATQPQRSDPVTPQQEHANPKSIQQNKLLYQILSNQSGNKNLRDARDMVQTIQTRALQEEVPIHQVVMNPRYHESGLDRAYHESSSSSFGHTLHENAPQVPKDAQVSGMFMKDTQKFNPTTMKEASHDYLYKEVRTKPTQTYLWKKGVDHEALAKAPTRTLPLFHTETNKKGLYTKANVVPDSLASGPIDHDKRHSSVESNRSVPYNATDIDRFRNVPLSVREDTRHTSVQSVVSRDKASLQDVLYKDTVEPSMRSNLPSTEAYSHKTFFDQNGEMGDMELREKRIAHVEASTARDTTAMGYHVYNIQSTDGSKNISHAPSAGSFDPTPSNVPMVHRQYDHGSERPVVANRHVQNRASSQYFERFSDPPTWAQQK
jgi:hypothetical protein